MRSETPRYSAGSAPGRPKASVPSAVTVATAMTCMSAASTATAPALASTARSEDVGPAMRAFQLLPRCSTRQMSAARMAIPTASGNRP